MIKRMAKAQEDMDDLKFQLEEKNIEFEGTRAQLRVLESKSQRRPDTIARSCSSLLNSHEDQVLDERVSGVSTASMRAMVPLLMTDDVQLQHSSSTESAHDHTEQQRLQSQQLQQPQLSDSTPKKRIPSRIPLPGMATVSAVKAPKPPSGRRMSTTAATTNSGPPSNRSLSQNNRQISTSSTSLNNRKELLLSSLTRPDSAQSWRNSFQTATTASPSNTGSPKEANTPSPYRMSTSTGSSIPIATSVTTSLGSTKGAILASPVKSKAVKGSRQEQQQQQQPQEKNVRGRNLMDSLTGQTPSQQLLKSPSNSMSSKLSTHSSSTPITMILNNNKQQQLNLSTTPTGRNVSHKASAVPVRRAGSRTSLSGGLGGGTPGLDGDGTATGDNGKVRNLRSSIWNWLKI